MFYYNDRILEHLIADDNFLENYHDVVIKDQSSKMMKKPKVIWSSENFVNMHLTFLIALNLHIKVK